MAFPSLRTVAVTSGFLGLSMIIAGTASAMAGAQDGGAVGTGIRLTQVEEPAASPTPSASRGADMIPGVPIEVGADPLLACDAEGDCSDTMGHPVPATADGGEASTARVTADAAAPATDPVSPQSGKDKRAAGDRDERADPDPRHGRGARGELDRSERGFSGAPRVERGHREDHGERDDRSRGDHRQYGDDRGPGAVSRGGGEHGGGGESQDHRARAAGTAPRNGAAPRRSTETIPTPAHARAGRN